MSLAEPVRLAEGQVAASGAVLARAMANDPVFTYMLSDPVERERLTPPFMTALTRYGLLVGEVDVTAVMSAPQPARFPTRGCGRPPVEPERQTRTSSPRGASGIRASKFSSCTVTGRRRYL
jgi:hypothetical protein